MEEEYPIRYKFSVKLFIGRPINPEKTAFALGIEIECGGVTIRSQSLRETLIMWLYSELVSPSICFGDSDHTKIDYPISITENLYHFVVNVIVFAKDNEKSSFKFWRQFTGMYPASFIIASVDNKEVVDWWKSRGDVKLFIVADQRKEYEIVDPYEYVFDEKFIYDYLNKKKETSWPFKCCILARASTWEEWYSKVYKDKFGEDKDLLFDQISALENGRVEELVLGEGKQEYRSYFVCLKGNCKSCEPEGLCSYERSGDEAYIALFRAFL
ncbi:unnamed protein product [Sphagnum balticum]